MSNQGNSVFNVPFLLNCACYDQRLYEAHIISHIILWSFSLLFDLG